MAWVQPRTEDSAQRCVPGMRSQGPLCVPIFLVDPHFPRFIHFPIFSLSSLPPLCSPLECVRPSSNPSLHHRTSPLSPPSPLSPAGTRCTIASSNNEAGSRKTNKFHKFRELSSARLMSPSAVHSPLPASQETNLTCYYKVSRPSS